jgi:hypothetical protein
VDRIVSAAKHTPGPWRLDDGSSPGTADLVASNYHFVDAGCGFHVEGHRDRGFSIAGVLSTADARLIAAAPELLAALQAVVLVADRKTAEFDLAHAAIAKATGSAS